MGRFHRHDDDSHHHHDHDHDHDHHHPIRDHVNSGIEDPENIGDHSAYETGSHRVEILESIYAENDHAADHNRALFDDHGVRCINVMSSPGAGKTALLAKTLEHFEGKTRIGVIEGDIETSLDADRLDGFGAQISLLNTGDGFGGECHLDAPMIAHALKGLDLHTLDLVLIENVGNLVCPAEFEVGEHGKAMVFSVTEGEDKPLKYPAMFRAVDTVVVNKVDLLPYIPFNMDLFLENLAKVNPTARVIRTSVTNGEGLDEWFDYIEGATGE